MRKPAKVPVGTTINRMATKLVSWLTPLNNPHQLATTTGETVVRPTQVATIADATRVRTASAKVAETNKSG